MIPKHCSKVRLYIELYPWKGGTLNYLIKDWGKIIHMRKPGSANVHVHVCLHTRAEKKKGEKKKKSYVGVDELGKGRQIEQNRVELDVCGCFPCTVLPFNHIVYASTRLSTK